MILWRSVRARMVVGVVSLCACVALWGCKGTPEVPPESNAPAAGGSTSVTPVTPPPPAVSSADLTRAEDARIGSLVRLNARGIGELHSKDADGEHFDQGDLYLGWNQTMGLAAKLSKLGDTWVWIGADTTSWWVFELKSKPTRLDTGPLNGERAGLAPAFPWLMGLRPLHPASGAEPELIKDTLRVKVDVPANALPAGAVLRAHFDPKTLIPTLTELTLSDGTVWRAGFTEWMSVETPGQAMGAWPRVPKRARAVSGMDDRGTTVVMSLEFARADPDATDRPALYDFVALRERFAPQHVETEK